MPTVLPLTNHQEASAPQILAAWAWPAAMGPVGEERRSRPDSSVRSYCNALPMMGLNAGGVPAPLCGRRWVSG